MRATDLVGTAGLAFYVEVALVLFFFSFLLVLAGLRSKKVASPDWTRQSRMPLDDADEDEALACTETTGGTRS